MRPDIILRHTDRHPLPELSFDLAKPFMTTSESGFGTLHHMALVLKMSETPPRWEQPTVPLGTHPATWA